MFWRRKVQGMSDKDLVAWLASIQGWQQAIYEVVEKIHRGDPCDIAALDAMKMKLKQSSDALAAAVAAQAPTKQQ
jgi:hypothetical protein